MPRVLFAIALLATLCVAPQTRVFGEEIPPASRLHLDGWALSDAQANGLRAKAAADDRVLTLTVEGRRYEIALRPAQTVLSGLAVAQRQASASVHLYRGTVLGMPHAWARATIAGDRLYAVLWDGEDFIAVEPQAIGASAGASKGASRASAHRAFRPLEYEDISFASDMRETLGAKLEAGSEFERKAVQGGLAKRDANARLDIAWVADSLFSARYGTSTEEQMLARINIVAGIFAEQLGLELGSSELSVLDASNDTFSSSDASRLLDQVEQYKLATTVRREAGVVHLLTGRALDGSTVGIAAVGAACSARFGVSLTEARRPAAVDALITAHEIGHNLNAPHDGEAACASAPNGYLMAPRLSQNDEFSACSMDVMEDFLARAACVRTVSSGDVSIVGDPPGAVLIGTVSTVEYMIDSPSVGDALDLDLMISFAEAGSV